MYSLVERRPIYLDYTLADFIAHQGQHVRLREIFVNPYITRLILGIGLVDRLQRLESIGGATPLGMDTLQLMGMVVCRDSR